jgi:hypothetical protein
MSLEEGQAVKHRQFPWHCEIVKIVTFTSGRTMAIIKPITNLDLKRIAVWTHKLELVETPIETDATQYPGFVFSWVNGYKRSKAPDGWSVYDPEWPKGV